MKQPLYSILSVSNICMSDIAVSLLNQMCNVHKRCFKISPLSKVKLIFWTLIVIDRLTNQRCAHIEVYTRKQSFGLKDLISTLKQQLKLLKTLWNKGYFPKHPVYYSWIIKSVYLLLCFFLKMVSFFLTLQSGVQTLTPREMPHTYQNTPWHTRAQRNFEVFKQNI